MIYTGDGLKVRISVLPTHYHHWMGFACYTSMKHYLPDATFELAITGRPMFFFDWAARFQLKVARHCAEHPNLLCVQSEFMAVRQWDDDWRNASVICEDAKSENYTPMVDVSGGVGAFVRSEWIDSHACFLKHVPNFRTGNETQTELAVLDGWQRAANLAACLGLNRT